MRGPRVELIAGRRWEGEWNFRARQFVWGRIDGYRVVEWFCLVYRFVIWIFDVEFVLWSAV